jgi:hypothetical protein
MAEIARIKSRVIGQRHFAPGEIVTIENIGPTGNFIVRGSDGVTVFVAEHELEIITLTEADNIRS